MIDKEKLRYDLAMNAAVVMTLQSIGKGKMGTAPSLMLNNFLDAYRQYSADGFNKLLNDVAAEINRSE